MIMHIAAHHLVYRERWFLLHVVVVAKPHAVGGLLHWNRVIITERLMMVMVVAVRHVVVQRRWSPMMTTILLWVVLMMIIAEVLMHS